VLELPRRAEGGGAGATTATEAAVAVELPRRAEAALVELPRCAQAAVVFARRWLEPCLQGALKRCRTADCRCCCPRGQRCRRSFRHAAAGRAAHDCPAESQCCPVCVLSYRPHLGCRATARQEARDCREASRCWLQGQQLLRRRRQHPSF
jgi:hypothetical protein